MDCKACRREIDCAAGGKDVSAVEALEHLASCPGCRAFSAERHALRELVASVEPVAAPNDFDWRLRARLAAEKSAGPGRHLRQSLAPGLPAIAFAALFVVFIAAAVYLKQARTERPTRTPAVATTNAPASNAPVARDKDSDESLRADEGRKHLAATTNALKSPTAGRERGGPGIQVKSSRPVGEATPMAVAATSNQTVRSNDFSSSVAPVVMLFSVPVRTPTQPVKVLLDEGSGTLRTVALQPVTFGSQEILRRSSGGGDAAGRSDRSAEEIW
jgi:hypothetical protein